MKEDLINRIAVTVSPYVDCEELATIKGRLSVIMNDYEITLETKELSTFVSRFPACYEYFIVTKKIEGMSENTIALYRLYIEDMLLTIRKDLNDITPNDIRAYLYKVQQDRQISNRSLNSRRSCLNSFFGWIAAEGYIGRNPMITVKPIKYAVKERQPLQAMDMERIRKACTDAREKAIIEILYSTSCRASELIGLNITDVNFTTDEVTLFGKGSKYRTAYLSSRAKLYLMDYLSSRNDDSPALIVSKKSGERLCRRSLERIVAEIGERAEVGHVFPHLLRHTSATDALAKGMPVTQVQQMLGHASLDTTMIYAKVAEHDVKISHSKYFY